MKKIALFLGLALLCLLITPRVLAQNVVLPFPQVTIAYQWVDVTIEDQVATTHVTQKFVNQNDWMAEGNYLFPLPAGAAVTQLTMWVDGVPIEANILPAGEARQIYDEIVRQLRDPALLEYVGSSAIQANVFPIPAGGERTIEIEYQQLLVADNGLFHYSYPQSANLYSNLPLGEQRISVDLRANEALRAIYSGSHPVDIFRHTDKHAVIGFEAANIQADNDFELHYSVSADEIGLNLLTYKEPGEDGFFVLLAAPGVEIDPDEIVERDIILIMDTSGSMAGEKLAQTKEAASYVVSNLNDGDRFNVVTFATGIRRFAEALVSAASAAESLDFIESLEAIGATNISLALLDALAQADDERPTTILFLTDGLATEGITDTDLLVAAIQQEAPANVRIFAFGVGDDVDTILLDSISSNHRGTTTYVRPNQSIQEEVTGFYAKISQPVLANLSIEVDGVVVEQFYPTTLPDLFAGTQLVVTGRYRDGGEASITLNGNINGRLARYSYDEQWFRVNSGSDFIPRLWATRAIGHLLTQIRIQGENQELIDSVVTLSLRYGIITPYTSFLITEDDIFSDQARAAAADEAADEFAAPAPASGADAVNEAEASGGMAGAAVPTPFAMATSAPGEMPPVPLAFVPPPDLLGTQNGQPVQYVGSKTFVYRDGLWLDTQFNPDAYQVERVGFASDTYFALIDVAPELATYLALSDRVLVVFQGVAYEVVLEGADTQITMPVAANNVGTDPSLMPSPVPLTRPASTSTPEVEIAAVNEDQINEQNNGERESLIDVTDPVPENENQQLENETSPRWPLLLGALFVLAGLALAVRLVMVRR